MLDDDTRYEALRARDPRFDGVFFVGVRSTGIYCRPICPARTPGRARCVFFPRTASAEAAGFRACLRCRPERAPGDASVDAVPRLVRAAMARIDAGALREGTLDDLARDLGVSARHLRRASESVLGVSLVDYAQSRRVALARALLRDTALPITDVAFAAGFRSLRRFHDAFHAQVGCAPGDLRRRTGEAREGELSLRLDHRPPLAWGPLWRFLAGRAIPGVERVEGDVYARTVRLGDATGWVRVAAAPEHPAVTLTVSRGLTGRLMELVAAVRHLLDLDAHPDAVDAALSTDPLLAARVARAPGLRVPGAFDGFEMAVRAVLGQQVSVRAATTLAGRLAAAHGEPVDDAPEGLSRRFPSPAALARVEATTLREIGLTAARAESIVMLARAVHRGRVDLRPGGDPDAAMQSLGAIPGVGPWTAQYVAMRALRWPDAFPAEDLVVRRALGDVTPTAARARAARWSPWRAYAVMHLWNEP